MRAFKVLQNGFRDTVKSYIVGEIVHSAKDLVSIWGPAWFEFIKDLPDGGDGNVPVPESSPPTESVLEITKKIKKPGRQKKAKVVVETPPEDTQGE